MFAKPAKKPVTQASKQKALSKPKTVAVKTGIKPTQTKKSKAESNVKKGRPPVRQDPGYSLYSTDSEDQVASSFREMDTCEKMLTHLKHLKQKGPDQSKQKKKTKDKSPRPKALNDIPPNSEAITVPGYGHIYQYGASQFLHHIQDTNNPTNPLFNLRLVSSTPDPDKHLEDHDSSKTLSHPDRSTQDIPVRDISGVSSVPPSQQHVRNMTDMLEIYKQLEIKKYVQLQEASAKAELERLNKQTAEVQNQPSSNVPVPQAYPVVGSGSLGFQVSHQGAPYGLSQTGSQPDSFQIHQTGSPNFQTLEQDIGRESSITAFQPYLARDSGGFVPPQAWLPSEAQNITPVLDPSKGQGQQDTHQNSQHSSTVETIPVQDIPLSDRTERSDSTHRSFGTDYTPLPHPEKESEVKGQPNSCDRNIVYKKQNGLFQLYQKKPDEDLESDKRSGKADSNQKGSIHEAPERDVPKFGEGTFNVESTGGNSQTSQNISDITTPRTQNISSTGSTVSSCGGKLVFIPNDSKTQNLIGYIPGVQVMQGGSQPISLPVTNDHSGTLIPNLSIPSSIGGNQGQSGSQLIGSQDGTGSSYHSAAHAKIIAAGDVGTRKLRYLLKELRECSKVTKDVEIGRLATELDEAVNAIPQLALTFNLQTEIDLAIQPLRTENSQLRRKLRLLNQQLKDKDIAAEEGPKDVNFEIMHLQTSNDALQKSLREEQDVKTRLAAEVQYLYGEIHKLKVEKSKWISESSEKETAQLKLRQETLLETQNLRHDVDLMRKDHEMTVANLEGLEKGNHILQITLQQRDAEIARQQEVIETMKESIADLLQELDQSRGGDMTWDQNKSFGLHKLMRIVEEEGTRFAKNEKKPQTVRKRAVTPERKRFDFDTTTASSSTATPRLTRAALAYHDRNHRPVRGARGGPDGRVGPASESELDTLVEMQRKDRRQAVLTNNGMVRQRRRTSSSSPVRFKADNVENLRHHRTGSSPVSRPMMRDGVRLYEREDVGPRRGRTYGREKDNRDLDLDESSPGFFPQRQMRSASFSPGKRNTRPHQSGHSQDRRMFSYTDRNVESSEVSMPQSRYSVTDYFKKYPQSSNTLTSEVDTEKPLPKSTKNGTSRPHDQSYKFRTSSEIGGENTGVLYPRNIKQLTLFKGMSDNQTISAINDDNMSSVSMASVTTANTIDDTKFRKGIATLDANIAKLQMALQKTKSMLS